MVFFPCDVAAASVVVVVGGVRWGGSASTIDMTEGMDAD